MRRGGSFFLNYIKKTLTPLANHLKQSSTLLAILPTMEKYKESLEKFIYNIQNRTISENEVIVGELNILTQLRHINSNKALFQVHL